MPIYEYVCKKCGNKFDSIRPMKEADSPIPCEKCSSIETKRALSVCFTHGTEKSTASHQSGGCGGCSGGSCGSCHS